jgi:hypothetical protein
LICFSLPLRGCQALKGREKHINQRGAIAVAGGMGAGYEV